MRAPLALINDLSGGHGGGPRAVYARTNYRSGQIWSGWVALGTAVCTAIGFGIQALTILP